MNEVPATDKQELLALSQRLLDVIDGRDWAGYAKLCDPSLTAFEPESVGNLVEGMAFHQFYFPNEGTAVESRQRSTICSPHVRLMGDVAVVSYVRLSQRADGGGNSTVTNEETRVWQRQDGIWQHVHFHRSRSGEVRL